MSDHNFNTPPEFLDKVRQLGPIGLDPCSNMYSMVQPRIEYFEGDNGLILPWRGFGLVFVNPPHSLSPYNIEPWMLKMHEEFYNTEPYGDQFVGLVPAKPDTAWFHDYAVKCTRRCFWRGRMKYWLNGEPTPGPGRFAQMVLYIGDKVQQFDDIFGPHGWLA